MASPCIAITHILVHPRRNVVVLLPDEKTLSFAEPGQPEAGMLDIGVKGRLIGIELGTDYFSVAQHDGHDDNLVRSVALSVIVVRDAREKVRMIEIPRRGAFYEITYPIGNQCWRQVIDGREIESCATTIVM